MNLIHAKVIGTKLLYWVPPTATIIIALDQTTINSLALLGVAIIGLWTARQGGKTVAKLETVQQTTNSIHALSNSAMGAQLQTAVDDAEEKAVLFHRIAEMGGNVAGDVAAAEAADKKVIERRKLLQAHMVQQAAVDAAQAALKNA